MFGEPKRVADWCAARIEHFSGWGTDPQAIAHEIDGEIRTAVVYTNYSRVNVVATIVCAAPLTRRFLGAIFLVPFNQWNVRHITCHIEESNAKSLKLCRHMGFTERGRLPECAWNGEDVIVMGLLKRHCRFI